MPGAQTPVPSLHGAVYQSSVAWSKVQDAAFVPAYRNKTRARLAFFYTSMPRAFTFSPACCMLDGFHVAGATYMAAAALAPWRLYSVPGMVPTHEDELLRRAFDTLHPLAGMANLASPTSGAMAVSVRLIRDSNAACLAAAERSPCCCSRLRRRAAVSDSACTARASFDCRVLLPWGIQRLSSASDSPPCQPWKLLCHDVRLHYVWSVRSISWFSSMTPVELHQPRRVFWILCFGILRPASAAIRC